MKIIYNESITNEHIQERCALQRGRFRSWIASVVGLVVFAAAMLAKPVYGITLSPWLFWPALAVGIVSAAVLVVSATGINEEEDPEPDILYSVKTKNCRVLGITIEYRDLCWHSDVPVVVLRTEDANGLVEKTDLCIAKFQESTVHTEETFDINKGIIYVPYKSRAAV